MPSNPVFGFEKGDVNHQQAGVGLFTVVIGPMVLCVHFNFSSIAAMPFIGAPHCHVLLRKPRKRLGAAV